MLKRSSLGFDYEYIFLQKCRLIMLVTRIVGDCPDCKAPNSYGNIGIWNDLLSRGCSVCGLTHKLPLPPLSKVVLYLDQFFYSHAFRDSSSDFAKIVSLIGKLAHHQLIVIPYSPIHKTETNVWPSDKKDALWEFIETASRGNQFLSVDSIKRAQIRNSFRSFLVKDPVELSVQSRDAAHDDFNKWENYFRVEVEIDREDPTVTRAGKIKTVEELLVLFESWRGKPSSFPEDVKAEFTGAAYSYRRHFANLMARLASGDRNALYDSHSDSIVIQEMLLDAPDSLSLIEKLEQCNAYFESEYFENVPYEHISNGLLAVLKHRVKMGQYSNSAKAREALSGFAFDLAFVSGYLPYCDAVFVDQAMYEMVTDSRLNLQEKFQTKVFSKLNWADFMDYLSAIPQNLSPEILRALKWVYPDD